MSFNDCKISESQIQTTGVQSQADTLTGSAADNKKVFDALPTLVIQKLNDLIDQLQQQAAAGQIGVTPFDGMTAQTLQAALEQIQADIGGNYGGADGAGKVGYTPSEGVDEDTVQAAIEAVQANLTAYIAKIKAATGAEEVGNAPIAGMTATNVQQALEELRENIDNIVSGIIPGGSITSDMLQDGAVTADKLGSDVTGDTIPTSASDLTSISSQLSNALRRTGNQTVDGIIASRSSIDHAAYASVTGTDAGGYIEWYKSFETYYKRSQLILGPPVDDAMPQLLLSQTFDGVHSDSVMVATATPPQEFDLLLVNGYTPQYTHSCIYYKTQETIVGVNVALIGEIPANSDVIIGTLPAGFRPKATCWGVAGSHFSPYGVGSVSIDENGNINVRFTAAQVRCNFTICFLAAD